MCMVTNEGSTMVYGLGYNLGGAVIIRICVWMTLVSKITQQTQVQI